MTADDDTEPLRFPPAEPPAADREAVPRELEPASERPMERWPSRTYEFASPDAALLFVAVVAALAMSSGSWPRVELHGARVRLGAGPLPPGERPSPQPAWSVWAKRLGGTEVAEESEPEPRDPKGDLC